MKVFCLGGKTIGDGLALELVEGFLWARISGAERHVRRIEKVRAIEEPAATVQRIASPGADVL